MTHVDASLVQQIFDIPERERETDKGRLFTMFMGKSLVSLSTRYGVRCLQLLLLDDKVLQILSESAFSGGVENADPVRWRSLLIFRRR